MSSDYDLSFYDQYRQYLQLPEVRQAHDEIFELFGRTASHRKVVDLGCATCEYGQYLLREWPWVEYVGIDLNPLITKLDDGLLDIRLGNYQDKSFDSLYQETDTFVSLFSTEIHLDCESKYALYERLFDCGMDYGLVSGFYYRSDPEAVQYTESTTKQTVYQTVESEADWVSEKFYEMRIRVNVPPGMFREEFVEVWKILMRR